MIQVEFSVHDHAPVGFCISGHAGAGSAGRDIVCAAVSSAAYMAANTLTDVIGAGAARPPDYPAAAAGKRL